MSGGSSETYGALLARLFAARRFGMKLELGRIRRCLERLGSPERRLGAVVHVGGTNGKGSSSAFAESMLREAGLCTGLFSSPHLSRFAERFAVAGEPAPEAAICEAARAVESVDPGDELTFFERVTAMALWLFAERGVEAAVLEVGLGGRFDATNAVEADVSVITGVHFDHERYLGGSLAEIAAEKAGIFRAGRPGVIGASGAPEGARLLAAEAERVGVRPLRVLGESDLAAVPGPLGLGGAHQRANAAAALGAVEELEALGLARVHPAARRRGLWAARLPGRMETLPGRPPVLLDGAHNPQAAAALAREVAARPHRRVVLVMAVSADKDVAGMAAPLAGLAHEVVATRTRGERSLGPDELAEALRPALAGRAPRTASDTGAALALARRLAGPEDLLVVAGSLFLIGEAREELLGVRPDRIALADPVGGGAKVCPPGGRNVRSLP